MTVAAGFTAASNSTCDFESGAEQCQYLDDASRHANTALAVAGRRLPSRTRTTGGHPLGRIMD